MTRLKFLCVGAALLLSVGCGTFTQGHMRQGPAALGGVRLDVAIMADDHTTVGSKIMAGLDILPSFAFDMVFLLPVSIWNEIYELIYYDGIEVRPPVHWDNPPPKYAPYSAKSEEDVPGRSSRPLDIEGVGLN
jgi:uncharacterized protein YceK